jgi:hypothetical protein
MGAYIARDQDRGREPRTVREFISEFRGLSGSAKQKLVLEEVGAARLSLREFFGAGDQVDTDAIAKLLAAMQRQSKPLKPQRSWHYWQGAFRFPIRDCRRRSEGVPVQAQLRRYGWHP